MPLDDGDLAYMRETQAEHRPTEATLDLPTRTTDGYGGRSAAYATGDPISVRIDTTPDEIPSELAARYEGGSLVRLTMDLVEVRKGYRVTVSPSEAYEVVSEGDNDPWTTAQQVWAHRLPV